MRQLVFISELRGEYHDVRSLEKKKKEPSILIMFDTVSFGIIEMCLLSPCFQSKAKRIVKLGKRQNESVGQAPTFEK